MTEVENVDCVVIGAGVVGLAVSRALARAGREVLILEAEEHFGTMVSSRNSEVVHAGIYYKPGSLMARHCVHGRKMLYDFCRAYGVEHSQCGKLIVATSGEEVARLEDIAAHASGNGVDDMRALDAAEARAMEPALHCHAALHSPSTGIVNSHALMLALLGDAENHGAILAVNTRVLGGRVLNDRIALATGEGMELRCRSVINSAGLDAPAVARHIAGMPSQIVPTTYYAKGNYFALSGRAPFSRLIYPVPVPGGLGVHLTLDLTGRARFGPDVEWVEAIDYTVDLKRADSFYAAIRRYWPALRDGALMPDYAGIRPKIVPKGARGQDFMIQGPREHGVAGLVNLFGIESPGLTAALSIAEHAQAALH